MESEDWKNAILCIATLLFLAFSVHSCNTFNLDWKKLEIEQQRLTQGVPT